MEVVDPGDPRIAEYVGLTDVARRLHIEPDYDGVGIFVAEGELVVRRAVEAGYLLRSLLVDAKRLPALEDLVKEYDVPAYLASQDVLAATTGFHVHRGVLASFARRPEPSLDQMLATSQRLLVCESLTSTTNLGAVLRSAAAFGIDGVLLSPDCCDPLYRRAVRVSMGEALRLPTRRLQPWPDALDAVRQAGFTVLALTPSPDAEPIDDVDTSGKVALLLGEEGPGLTDDALRAADRRVRIPIAAGVDSLNVAAAAAVACYVVRQP
jgi:tRNA G18 (ribose-2'-O)-methylase SpoU